MSVSSFDVIHIIIFSTRYAYTDFNWIVWIRSKIGWLPIHGWFYWRFKHSNNCHDLSVKVKLSFKAALRIGSTALRRLVGLNPDWNNGYEMSNLSIPSQAGASIVLELWCCNYFLIGQCMFSPGTAYACEIFLSSVANYINCYHSTRTNAKLFQAHRAG